MKRLLRFALLPLLITIVISVQTVTHAQQGAAQYDPSSVSGMKFLYVEINNESFFENGRLHHSVGTLKLTNSGVYPDFKSAEFDLLCGRVERMLTEEEGYDHRSEVTCTLDPTKTVLQIKWGSFRFNFSGNLLHKVADVVISEFFNGQALHLFERNARINYKSLWGIRSYDQKESPDLHWSVWAMFGPGVDLAEHRTKDGAYYLQINLVYGSSNSSTPTQEVRIGIAKKGKPYLMYAKWYDKGFHPQPVQPRDVFGEYYSRFIPDLPPQIRKYLSPEILAAIKAAAR